MKKAISIIIFAALCASLFCPAFFAGADPLPTSACVSGLTARFTAGEDVIGSIAIEAAVEGVADDEYFNVSVYTSVSDISAVPDSSVEPMAFRLFKPHNLILNRRAIPYPGPPNCSAIECAVAQMFSDDFMRMRCRMGREA